MNKELVIDPEFLRLTVPATDEQQAELEKSLLEEGCREPILTWNNIIIDGHKRYSFCSFEEIEFDVMPLHFSSRDHAISWICRKRLNDLPPGSAIYKFLTGKWYRSLRPKYTEMIKEGIIEAPVDNSGHIRVSKVLAQDLGVGYSVIENGEAYARYMEKIADADPDIFEALVSGKLRVSVRELRFLAKRNQKTRSIVLSRLYPDQFVQTQDNKNRKAGRDTGIVLSTAIKEMPAFDPDMEISGLALTIPTWIAAIARAEKKTDMNLATDYAKKQLAGSLLRLESQIQKTLEALECTDKDF